MFVCLCVYAHVSAEARRVHWILSPTYMPDTKLQAPVTLVLSYGNKCSYLAEPSSVLMTDFLV